MGVIEDGPVPANVELAVGVAGHAACRRGLDIHLRRAVNGADHGGLLFTGRGGVRHNPGGLHRDGTRGQPQRKAECADATDKTLKRVPDPGGRRSARTAARQLGNDHQHAAGFIKDDTVQTFIHGEILFIFVRAAGACVSSSAALRA